MRRARNQKTRKSVAKRFKITATGKVMQSHAGRRHLLAHKSPDRRRRLRKQVEAPSGDARRVKESLPFSH